MLAAELGAEVCEPPKAQVGEFHGVETFRVILDECLRLVKETPHLGEVIVCEEFAKTNNLRIGDTFTVEGARK